MNGKALFREAANSLTRAKTCSGSSADAAWLLISLNIYDR